MWNSVAMDVDSPPGSRLFVVCGKAVEAAVLELAFSPYGHVQSIKIVREKGVAYVKYDKASSAALAMEALNGAVLNNGRGPKLKVLLADSPNQRSIQPKPMMQEQEVSNDPDNVPPRSRLFIVVPKQAEAQHIQDDLGSFPDLEYCKTDLIASKGVVFCKFTKSSSALRALEDITQRGTVAGYKVKCMLAEPKTKRGRPEGAHQEVYSPMHQAAKLHDYGLPPDAAMAAALSPSPIPGVPMPDYSSIGSLSGLVSGIGMAGVAGAIAMSDALSAGSLQPELRALTQVGLGGYAMGMGVPNGSPVSPSSSPVLSKQRLFVVVHKSITSKEGLERLFRRFPGMEYFDLKMDKNHPGRNKGFGFVNYSTPEAAAAAVEQLNGFEFPPQSGHRIKVMHAEPLLGVKHNSGLPSPMPINSPSPVHTPLSRGVAADLASVQDSLAKMSMPRVGSGNGVEDLDRHMASPVNSTHTVARELMFTTS